MNKYLYTSIIAIVISLINFKHAYASEKISYASSKVKGAVEVTLAEDHYDVRIYKLRNFLKRNNSSLSLYSELIVREADENNIPWTVIPSIAGVESTFCKHIPYQSANCWGWNNGRTRFKGYDNAIVEISYTLGKKYYRKGLNTPEKIAPVYAPPSATWAVKLRHFMNLIENETVETNNYINISI
ncbi:hypothetical protein COV53_05300 [Candidatus Gottesmanbacteria bacterium CG11_big_fil_rev_8_21_14_0_20_37_11]|uniref:Mannosyl-glycoprotein endo-beta-N-acetylglucosamidase-like domain-containing protein n=3 Tax=Candidatus Gottesmaniibacteriota TaxID=1752720 RepID=A0A2M7RQP6_9BACT|nr:MAG: hypothetical protein AUJ73_04835 [Candidatus Gottesmanbacteria bacterium CG1_02_37_22]PIP32918.1 MAG: hypothetical protein COX23_02140 [Candidatus Gottesmanbacteria bacterium CG23_combo_of_CG06-09_8_20_14_all_37_19]PIR07999.1 MAG: hypothetical protein COV53_05300 [Candidatus Gottesmanbacteria bacterium CG11_big_fil_rev_8_21_14_0_20_37_11]PIZ02510.1 MAG: hypothetical protein COY59_04370 [Candidatus Gottesmanbacteria bacterium CG_4_10_14_0_8_um_filter_37_24]